MTNSVLHIQETQTNCDPFSKLQGILAQIWFFYHQNHFYSSLTCNNWFASLYFQVLYSQVFSTAEIISQPKPASFIFCTLQVCQATRQNPKTAWRVPWVLAVSLAWWDGPAWWECRACRDFARRGTAAFMHRWCAKSRASWKDPPVPKCEPEHKQQRPVWDVWSLRSTWWQLTEFHLVLRLALNGKKKKNTIS